MKVKSRMQFFLEFLHIPLWYINKQGIFYKDRNKFTIGRSENVSYLCHKKRSVYMKIPEILHGRNPLSGCYGVPNCKRTGD